MKTFYKAVSFVTVRRSTNTKSPKKSCQFTNKSDFCRWTVVIVSGTLNWDFQNSQNVLATVSAYISGCKYRFRFDDGTGPTKSIWIWRKQLLGSSNSHSATDVWERFYIHRDCSWEKSWQHALTATDSIFGERNLLSMQRTMELRKN